MRFPLSVSFWISRTNVHAGLGTHCSLLEPTLARFWTSHFASVELRPCASQPLVVPSGEPVSELRVSLTLHDTREELLKNACKEGLSDSTVAYWGIGGPQSPGYPPAIFGGALCSGDLMRGLACNRDSLVTFSINGVSGPIQIVPRTTVEFTGFGIAVDWRASGPPERRAEYERRFAHRWAGERPRSDPQSESPSAPGASNT